MAQVFGIPTPDPMEDHSLFKVFSIEKTTSEYLNASKPVRIFHIKTKTWMQISEEDVNLDEAKVKEDIVMNRVGAVMDSRIKFSSHMEVSDFSNALVLFPVKMKQIDEMEYVTNFRRVVRQINDLSRKNNEDKFVNITHEEEQALIEIIGKLIIFSTDSHDINPFTRVGLPISFHQQLIRQTGLLDSFVAFLNIPEKQWDVLKSEKRHLEGGSGPATGNLVGLDAADAAVSSTSLSATNHSGIKTVMRFVHRLLTVFLKGKNEDNEIYIFNVRKEMCWDTTQSVIHHPFFSISNSFSHKSPLKTSMRRTP